MGNKYDYDELMNLIDTIKICSGRDEVKLIGDNKSFEELMAIGFPLGKFKCENIGDVLDESKLYIIPIDNDEVEYEQEA